MSSCQKHRRGSLKYEGKNTDRRNPIDRAMSLDTGMNQQVSEPKEVRFEESADILSRSPDRDHERAHKWYSPYELRSFREESKSTLRALEKANWNPFALDQEKHCLRGLEDLQSRRGSMPDKRSLTRSVVHGVLEEQLNQRRMGISDPKGLQVLVTACSKRAKERALFTGKSDEQEVFKDFVFESSSSSLDCSEESGTSDKLTPRTYGTTKLHLNGRQSKASNARSA